MDLEKNSEQIPATFGGLGWQPRVASHLEEVRAGKIWRSCGYLSEVAPLREVILTVPNLDWPNFDDPNSILLLESLNLELLNKQAKNVSTFYQSLGISVQRVSAPLSVTPNYLFLRDLFFISPFGAVLARPASQQRAGEERQIAAALTSLGVPIVGSLAGHATFEGADLLWLRPDVLLLGVGQRTNREAASILTRLIADLGYQLKIVALPAGIQHLLGVINFLAEDLVAVDQTFVTTELREVLMESGYQLVFLSEENELRHRRGLNFVTLDVRQIVMPANCPRIRSRLQDFGVVVHELDVSEYLKAGGGLGCLTGILRRA